MSDIPILISRNDSAYSFVKDGYWRITTATFRRYKGPKKIFDEKYKTVDDARVAAFNMGFGKFYERLHGKKEMYRLHTHKETTDWKTIYSKSSIRKQAEKINALISQGRLETNEVNQLVEHGIDVEVIEYWKAIQPRKPDGRGQITDV